MSTVDRRDRIQTRIPFPAPVALLAVGAVALLLPARATAGGLAEKARRAVAERIQIEGDGDEAAPLTAEEAAQVFDAFLTAVIKRAGADAVRSELRGDLLALLLDERHHIVQTLAAASSDGPVLLTEHLSSTWEQLDPLLDRVAAELPPEVARRYRRFLETGRLAERARAKGWLRGETSPAALRSLARTILPDDAADPLAYGTDVDPELRAIFGLGDPLPGGLASPLLEDAGQVSFQVGPLGLLARLAEGAGNWLVPTAHAAASGWDWHELVTRLNAWVPEGSRDMSEYLPMLREMLDGTAHTLAETKLAPDHFAVYRNLVVTTAWQESCWRQYVKKAGQVQPVRGPGPSYGLMQINTRVWRGLYDAKSISADIGYNGRAGAEILYHYMRKHALRAKEHLAPGGDTNLARATWAAYNGGPGHLRRYRSASTSSHLRRVDAEFWRKFQAVARGDQDAFMSCGVH